MFLNDNVLILIISYWSERIALLYFVSVFELFSLLNAPSKKKKSRTKYYVITRTRILMTQKLKKKAIKITYKWPFKMSKKFLLNDIKIL